MTRIQMIMLTAGFLVVTLFAAPVAVNAQNTQGGQDTFNNQTQPGTNDNPAGGTTNRTQTNTIEENQGFDWRWLLPLLAIPVIWLILRRTDESEEYRDQRSSYMAGSKGGRSRRERSNRDEYDDDEM